MSLTEFFNKLFNPRNTLSYKELQHLHDLQRQRIEKLNEDIARKERDAKLQANMLQGRIESERKKDKKIKELENKLREKNMADAILNTLMILGIVKTDKDTNELMAESDRQRIFHDGLARRQGNYPNYMPRDTSGLRGIFT